VYGIVAFAYRQRDPLLPGYRPKCLRTATVAQVDVKRGDSVRGHLAERVLRRANVDRLPVAVEHQHNRLVQYVAHKVFAHGHCASRLRCLFLIE